MIDKFIYLFIQLSIYLFLRQFDRNMCSFLYFFFYSDMSIFTHK